MSECLNPKPVCCGKPVTVDVCCFCPTSSGECCNNPVPEEVCCEQPDPTPCGECANCTPTPTRS